VTAVLRLPELIRVPGVCGDVELLIQVSMMKTKGLLNLRLNAIDLIDKKVRILGKRKKERIIYILDQLLKL